jgi:hypothetical protein
MLDPECGLQSFEMLGTTYATPQYNIAEEMNLQKLHCGKLKSHTIMGTLPER